MQLLGPRTGDRNSKRASKAPPFPVKRTRSPKRSSASGTARSGTISQAPLANAHSQSSWSACEDARCCRSSASWSTSGSAAAATKSSGATGSAPHRSSTDTSPISRRSHTLPGLAGSSRAQVSHPATRARPRIRFGTATGATSVISSTAGSSSASACVAARTAGESAGNSRKTSPSVPVVRSPGVISSCRTPSRPGMTSTADAVLCTRVRVRSAADGSRAVSCPLGRG